VLSGRAPVIRLERDGEQTACWQYVRAKTAVLQPQFNVGSISTTTGGAAPVVIVGLQFALAITSTYLWVFAKAKFAAVSTPILRQFKCAKSYGLP